MGSYRFKIILAGDEAVGKTSTILRFVHNTYSEMYKPTLGFQISVKAMNYKTTTPPNEERSVVLSMWDIAGQGQFAAVRKGYYAGTDGVLLLFDLTRRKTFENAKAWADEIRTVVPNAPIVLVGNKSDLPNQAVLPQELTDISTEQKFARYAITSAATGRGIDEVFRLVAEALIGALPSSNNGVPEIHVEHKPVVQDVLPGFTLTGVKPSVAQSPTPEIPPEVKAPVQRHPPIIPQLQIKLPAVRNVPSTPPAESKPVVIPPSLERPPAPGAVETPAMSPVPVEAPVSVESPPASQSFVIVPGKIKPQVPAPQHPFVPHGSGDETPPSKPKKEGFWKKLLHEK